MPWYSRRRSSRWSSPLELSACAPAEQEGRCETYQLPDPITVTLCFFENGASEDILGAGGGARCFEVWAMRRAAWLAVAAETGAIVSTVPCTISYQRTAPLVEVLATEQEETSRGGAEGQEEREEEGRGSSRTQSVHVPSRGPEQKRRTVSFRRITARKAFTAQRKRDS